MFSGWLGKSSGNGNNSNGTSAPVPVPSQLTGLENVRDSVELRRRIETHTHQIVWKYVVYQCFVCKQVHRTNSERNARCHHSYCNSVIQSLYYCEPFRECLLAYEYPNSTLLSGLNAFDGSPETKEKTLSDAESILSKAAFDPTLNQDLFSDNLLAAMRDMFIKMQALSVNKKKSVYAPSKFIQKLKKENELFRNTNHQDAQEMLIYTLNALNDILVKQLKAIPKELYATKDKPDKPVEESWVHSLFQGQLTSETTCLTCETTTNRDEPFLDLSLDVEPNTSLTGCLDHFSASEVLCHRNKFYCDACRSLQEAERRMKIKQLPPILVIHLKRFKYQERLERFTKMTDRVAFARDLSLFHTAEGTLDADRIYRLFAIIVHIGSGPHHGHYITVVKHLDSWFVIDDDEAQKIPELELQTFFGDSKGTGYMFFYVTADYEATEILRTLGGRRKREEEKEKVENTEPAPKDKGKGAPSASSKTVSKKPGLADLSAALSLDAQAPSNASPIHSPQPPQQLPGPPSSSGSGFVNYFWRSSSSTSEHKE